MPRPEEIRARVDGVIAALKGASVWDVPEPSSEAIAAGGAFGGETMSFEQWLRWVFVPSIEQRLASDGPWPTSSMVAARAVREADGNPVLDPVVDALRAFDELFEPPDPAALLRRAEEQWNAGKVDDAIASAEAAVRANEKHPNALNYAGWLLTRKASLAPDESERALAHFLRAVELDPSKPAPAANYGDLLLRLGRDTEAFAWMETRAEKPESAALAHNWLGYWRMQGGEIERAVTHFAAAVKARPAWGLARKNLGEALERAKRAGEAWEVLDPARHAFENDAQRAFAHERRGAYAARKGWLRTALREMRRAVVCAERAKLATGETTDAERWIAARLGAEGIFTPSFALERRWLASPPDVAETRRRTRAELENARDGASPQARTVIDALFAVVRGDAPAPPIDATALAALREDARSESGAALALGERWLAAHWERRAAEELPPESGLCDEDGAPLPGVVLDAVRRARAFDFAGAADLLEGAPMHALEARGVAEEAGDAADDAGELAAAKRLWALALRGAREHASYATSGGEGLARMVDVHRLEAKLGS